MWLVFAFHWNIHYKVFIVEHVPVKLKDLKASSFVSSENMKETSVFMGPDPRFLVCRCWIPKDL